MNRGAPRWCFYVRFFVYPRGSVLFCVVLWIFACCLKIVQFCNLVDARSWSQDRALEHWISTVYMLWSMRRCSEGMYTSYALAIVVSHCVRAEYAVLVLAQVRSRRWFELDVCVGSTCCCVIQLLVQVLARARGRCSL